MIQSIVANPMVFKAVEELGLGDPALTTHELHALSPVLGKDALPNLRKLCIENILIGSNDMIAIVQGLGKSTCAEKVQVLNLNSSRICAEGAKVLGMAIGRDLLPSLQELCILYSDDIGDSGVTSLALGLQASSRTKLTRLYMGAVGMGDAGLKSLAEAIRGGALENCSFLDISYKSPSLRNIIPFAAALRSGGLEKIKHFRAVQIFSEIVPESVAILVYSLMEHCPQLDTLCIPDFRPGAAQVFRDISTFLERKVNIR